MFENEENDPPLRSYLGRDTDLQARLAEEEPEKDGPADVPYDRAPGAVGQLVAEPDDDGPEDEEGEEQSIFAHAEGAPRKDAAPEEAAMFLESAERGHEWYDEEDLGDEEEETDEPQRDDSAAEFAFDEDEEDELA